MDINQNKESIDLENGVLGAIILEEYAINLVDGDLKVDLFTVPNNQIVCESILSLKKKNIKIDLLTVCQEIKTLGKWENLIEGGRYVSGLTSRVATASNIEIHMKMLQQLFLLRETQRICQYGLIKSNEHAADGFDIISDVIAKFEQTEKDLTSNKSFETINSLADKFLSDLQAKKDGIMPPSLSTGLKQLDPAGGFFNSDFIILAARPGMGKTALALKFLRNCVIDLKKPAGCFTIEMSSMQLLMRIASSECQIDSEDLRDGKVTDHQINDIYKKVQELRKLPLHIDATGGISIDQLVYKAKKMKREFKIELLVIDYLQLITTSEYRGDKTRQIGHISNRLKQLAKDLDIPVIALSQLSRKIEERKPEDRMPIMSDLRESGDIEQDADQIIFIFRPQYYGLKTFFIGGREMNVEGQAFIKYAKNRHGKLSTQLFKFIGKFTDFADIAPDNQTELI